LPPQKAEPTQPKPLPPKTAERAPKPLPPKTVEPEPKPLPPKTVEPEPKPLPLKTVEVQPKPLAPVAAVPQPKPSPAPPAPPQAKPLPAQPAAPPPPPPPPLPQQVAKVEPPPEPPDCTKASGHFHLDQSEPLTVYQSSIGGSACRNKLTASGTTHFTGASITSQANNGHVTQIGDYEFEYRPPPRAKGFKGLDPYSVTVCGASDAGSGCSLITYVTTVE